MCVYEESNLIAKFVGRAGIVAAFFSGPREVFEIKKVIMD